MSNPLPAAWLDAKPARVLIHWTAGSHTPSAVDREHYHYLIDGQAQAHRGDHPLSANCPTLRRPYAAHTRGMNTGSAGLALCGMAGARERPFEPGRWPFTREQWRVAQAVAAQLLRHAGLPCTQATCFSHFEAETLHGVRQAGKWDVSVLPWEPERAPAHVMAEFRAGVAALLSPPVSVTVDGRPVDVPAFLEAGRAWVAARRVAELLGWELVAAAGAEVTLQRDGQEITLPLRIEADGTGYVPAASLRALPGVAVDWDPAARVVEVLSE